MEDDVGFYYDWPYKINLSDSSLIGLCNPMEIRSGIGNLISKISEIYSTTLIARDGLSLLNYGDSANSGKFRFYVSIVRDGYSAIDFTNAKKILKESLDMIPIKPVLIPGINEDLCELVRGYAN